MSCQPCGCDPEAFWVCQRHQEEVGEMSVEQRAQANETAHSDGPTWECAQCGRPCSVAFLDCAKCGSPRAQLVQRQYEIRCHRDDSAHLPGASKPLTKTEWREFAKWQHDTIRDLLAELGRVREEKERLEYIETALGTVTTESEAILRVFAAADDDANLDRADAELETLIMHSKALRTLQEQIGKLEQEMRELPIGGAAFYWRSIHEWADQLAALLPSQEIPNAG